MTLAEIEDYLAQSVGRWRSQTAAEQRGDLVELGDRLGQLDDLGTDLVDAHPLDEVRSRIEILMDEIEIRRGVQPSPITGVLDRGSSNYLAHFGRAKWLVQPTHLRRGSSIRSHHCRLPEVSSPSASPNGARCFDQSEPITVTNDSPNRSRPARPLPGSCR